MRIQNSYTQRRPISWQPQTEQDMNAPQIPYVHEDFSPEEMVCRAQSFYEKLNQRRSIRSFSEKPVDRSLIELAIQTASSAPSGAHRQPWRFVAVQDSEIKRQIRIAAEKEERESYEGGRMPPQWRDALAPIGTNWQKPYLETVPWIVVAFEEVYQIDSEGNRRPNYYVKESIGIACGLFITAIHWMGLTTLTHTPSPMAFLSQILERPENERPFVLFPVGYPAADVTVPDLQRKSLDEISIWK